MLNVNTDFAVASAALPKDTYSRILDSGASRHFEPNRGLFTNFRTIELKSVTSAGGDSFQAIGQEVEPEL